MHEVHSLGCDCGQNQILQLQDVNVSMGRETVLSSSLGGVLHPLLNMHLPCETCSHLSGEMGKAQEETPTSEPSFRILEHPPKHY